MNKRLKDNPYLFLILIFSFYLLSQAFQHYVLRFSSISNPLSEEQAFIDSQHWLNILRLGLILISMFLLVIAWVIIFFHFYEVSRFWAVSALIFLVFFCLFEIFYRSLELYMVVLVWGADAVTAEGEQLEKLLGQYSMFESFVSALYFPLLFSQFLGSLILTYISSHAKSWLFMAAMLLNVLRLAFRLSDYVGLPELNIFSGAWYFPPVATIFMLLILWSWREYRKHL